MRSATTKRDDEVGRAHLVWTSAFTLVVVVRWCFMADVHRRHGAPRERGFAWVHGSSTLYLPDQTP
jgi:hypothetical protein